MKPIPFINPVFPDPKELAPAFEQIYKNNFYTNNGPFYYEFKDAAEAYLGQGLHVSIMANATLGLMLAIKILMKPGRKQVIIPSFTFAAGPQAILWCGFEPLFMDINRDDFQPKLSQVVEYLKSNHQDVAGILMCNTFGIGAPDIAEWEALAKQYDLPLVIDSASGFGSVYTDGSKVGGRGDCEVFSLHATKPFGIGEGSIVSSKSEELIDKLEQAKNFGFDEAKQAVVPALNAKITEFACAIGLKLLPELDKSLAKRRQNLRYYKKLLASHDVDFVKYDENAAVQFVSVLAPAEGNKKQTVLATLKDNKIEARDYYCPPVHTHQFFKDYANLGLDDTDYLSKRVISLPSSPTLTEADIERTCAVIVKYL